MFIWRLMRCNPAGGKGYDSPAWPPEGIKAGDALPTPSGRMPALDDDDALQIDDGLPTCCICLVNHVDTALVPCFHASFCGECADSLVARPRASACTVVAANVTAGAHTISIVVAPASFDDPAMHVAVSQLMVV